MELLPSTVEFVSKLDSFSAHKLSRRDDLGVLIDLASRSGRSEILDELSFLAKFVSKCHAIMMRIGPGGQGYDKLMAEYTANLEKARTLLRSLFSSSTPNLQRHFESTYLDMSHQSLQNLLALFYDLSWYKNWQIDVSRRKK